MRLKNCEGRLVHYDGQIWQVKDRNGRLLSMSSISHYYNQTWHLKLPPETEVVVEGGYLHIRVTRLSWLGVNGIFVWNHKLWRITCNGECIVKATCIGHWRKDRWLDAGCESRDFDGHMILSEKGGFHYANEA